MESQRVNIHGEGFALDISTRGRLTARRFLEEQVGVLWRSWLRSFWRTHTNKNVVSIGLSISQEPARSSIGVTRCNVMVWEM